MSAAADTPLLAIDELAVSFASGNGPIAAVRGASLTIGRGEVVALVGESGSGKSVTALTLLGLTRGRGTTVSGRADFAGTDLVAAPDGELRAIRGKRIAMVFQDPMSSLNPVHRIGAQIVEQILAHEPVGKQEARRRAIEALGEVGIPRPENAWMPIRTSSPAACASA